MNMARNPLVARASRPCEQKSFTRFLFLVAILALAFSVIKCPAGETGLWLSLPAGSSYSVSLNGKKVALTQTGIWDYPLRADLKIGRQSATVEITREPKK
jgi:hypothetical protein